MGFSNIDDAAESVDTKINELLSKLELSLTDLRNTSAPFPDPEIVETTAINPGNVSAASLEIGSDGGAWTDIDTSIANVVVPEDQYTFNDIKEQIKQAYYEGVTTSKGASRVDPFGAVLNHEKILLEKGPFTRTIGTAPSSEFVFEVPDSPEIVAFLNEWSEDIDVNASAYGRINVSDTGDTDDLDHSPGVPDFDTAAILKMISDTDIDRYGYDSEFLEAIEQKAATLYSTVQSIFNKIVVKSAVLAKELEVDTQELNDELDMIARKAAMRGFPNFISPAATEQAIATNAFQKKRAEKTTQATKTIAGKINESRIYGLDTSLDIENVRAGAYMALRELQGSAINALITKFEVEVQERITYLRANLDYIKLQIDASATNAENEGRRINVQKGIDTDVIGRTTKEFLAQNDSAISEGGVRLEYDKAAFIDSKSRTEGNIAKVKGAISLYDAQVKYDVSEGGAHISTERSNLQHVESVARRDIALANSKIKEHKAEFSVYRGETEAQTRMERSGLSKTDADARNQEYLVEAAIERYKSGLEQIMASSDIQVATEEANVGYIESKVTEQVRRLREDLKTLSYKVEFDIKHGLSEIDGLEVNHGMKELQLSSELENLNVAVDRMSTNLETWKQRYEGQIRTATASTGAYVDQINSVGNSISYIDTTSLEEEVTSS
jgi:hypothetical protein